MSQDIRSIHNLHGMLCIFLYILIANAFVDKVDADVKRWLSPPDPSTNHNHNLQNRHEQTGLWLLQHEDFEEWKETDYGVYWMFGLGAHQFAVTLAL